ncbi:MFS transporter [Pseudonocardia sp. H11422]|uniref:MFS transporter n=1 Tax=Pseudonocardia sp. H11422 TaxID=2835866 RepID=UPI001BDC8737|nr:MFS transporter [Pseudonocardia sp. H11422]
MLETAARPRPALVVAFLSACGLLVALNQTLVVPLLPAFPQLLGTSTATAAWLVSVTLVTGAVCAPVMGRLGDMYGKRRLLLVALGLMTAGSVIGALAPNVGVLIVARALHGAALGVIPLGLSILRDELPPDRVGGGIALVSSSLGIGNAIGLPLTGAMAQFLGWRWLFGAVGVAGAVLLLLTRRVVGESPERTGGRFDLPGAIGLGTALVCLLLAVSKGTEWGWTSPAIIGLAVAAVVLFAGWGRYELGRTRPLVDLRVSARPAVLWTNVTSVLVGFAMFASLMTSTQVLQAPVATGYGFGQSLAVAGLLLLPIGVSMAVFSQVSAWLSRRRGPRTALLVGTGVLVLGNIGMATLPGRIPLVMLAVAVIAAGTALAYSALPLQLMTGVPRTETAAANSLNTLCRMLGTSSCSAVVAAVTTGFTVEIGGRTIPAGSAYTVLFGIAAGVAVVAVVVSALTAPRQPPAGATASAPARTAFAGERPG